MKPYEKVEVSEAQLEDLIRQHPELIEDGLIYLDHQKSGAGGRLDVLLVDSGKSLIVAELKVVQDDGMLMQGVDYYDFVTTHVERFARLYGATSIDPTKPVRLVLIAPSFSQAIVNRCKWIDIDISLFTFQCLKIEGKEDVVPIFAEEAIPVRIKGPEITRIEDHLEYITDLAVRAKASTLLEEAKNWLPGKALLDPIKDAISMKINGRVFAYFSPRRKHFVVATFDDNDNWTGFPINDDDDLEKVRSLMKAALERRK